MSKKIKLKSIFLTGLLGLAPSIITLWMLKLIIGIMDQILFFLPKTWKLKQIIGFYFPGLGILFILIIIFFVGLLTQNFFGKQLVEIWNQILRRIPIIGPIYISIKQVSDILFSGNGNSFRKALLIEYPKEGIYTIAFLTGYPSKNIIGNLGTDSVSVYIPSTPNPTSGFLVIMPKNKIIELDITVDVALKYIISMGVVNAPPTLGT